MPNFIKSLLIASEKAANIARVCRSEQHLFSLLVEEKKGEEGNQRFVQDFKTLADVLIQETVRHDIAKEFPQMMAYIKGEESNVFSNTMNTKIYVEVKENIDETAELLAMVLDGDQRAADLLAAEVHRDVQFNLINTQNTESLDNISLDISDLGIWIDPIDSTAEYIHGQESTSEHHDIHKSGLQCVTVLIGVFNRTTGLPIAGVINQPFHTNDNNTWRGKCYWGVSLENQTITSERDDQIATNKIAVSSVENTDVKSALGSVGLQPIDAAGAGYKILTVCNGITGAYVMSRDSIYKWDTCGPHGILRSLGGGIIDFKCAVAGKLEEITYDKDFRTISKDIRIWRNKGGIIAYRNKEILNKILSALASNCQ